MRILYVTPELTPVIKTGGLGDVAGALPAALRRLGVDARILLPGYAQALAALDTRALTPLLEVLPGLPPVQILESRLPGTDVTVYVVHCTALFERDGGPYQRLDGAEWPDNALRFGLFSRVAAWLGTRASPLDWQPDIVHCNDWQSGLAPAYLQFAPDRIARTVLSIHNMAFVGAYGAQLVGPLGLPWHGFRPDGFEFHGSLSFLKAGLQYADRLTTVSPTYAQEIQRPDFAFGLDGVLAYRQPALSGILNGIDTREWDPSRDPHLTRTYDIESLRGKQYNKRALKKRVGLAAASDTPLLGMVCRLSAQKGVDLVIGALHRLAGHRFQVVILGSGSRSLEAELRALARAAPDRFAFVGEFNETLAHLIEGGADIFLMPSRFEPCGLNQMYSMRYGTVPVVRRTGGLADTVIDATPDNLQAGRATGFVFDHANVDGLAWALERALHKYADRSAWKSLQRAGMRSDWSWARSAAAYRRLYTELQ